MALVKAVTLLADHHGVTPGEMKLRSLESADYMPLCHAPERFFCLAPE